jgi:hypothetical protein
VTVAYAATGRSPFGAGNSHSILYRVMYGDPDIASVPDSLLPLVEASLAKEPQSRPTAQQLLDRLTGSSRRPGQVNDTATTQVILARTWQSGSHPSVPPASRPAEPNPALPRQPAAPAARSAAAPATETPTADQAIPVLPRGAAPSAMAPAAVAPAPEKIPVGRRMATIATSALVAMRLRRPSRREEPKR